MKNSMIDGLEVENRDSDIIRGKEIATECLMSDKEDNTFWLFVEGKSDEICLQKFITENIRIKNAENKQRAISALKYFLEIKATESQKKDRTPVTKDAIAIVDADYDRILSVEYDVKGLFLTDDHDFLVQAIKSSSGLGAVLSYTNSSSQECHNVCSMIFERCRIIGYIRIVNEREKLGINFGENHIARCYDNDEDIISFIISKKLNNKISEEDFRKKLEIEQKNNWNDNQLCQGHDLCSALSKLIGSLKNTKNHSAKTIQETLMLAYDSNDFKQTDLYQDICIWGEVHNVKIFKM